MEAAAKIALVTGANGNLGQAVCARLARDHRVVQVERERALLDGQPFAQVDLDSAEATHELMARVRTELGSLEAVVHTVGAFSMSGDAASWQSGGFQTAFATNVLTTVNVLSAAFATMRTAGRGQVVVVSSMAAISAGRGVAAYSASKAAQLRVIESAAAELVGTAMALTAVLPGTMDTPQNRAAMPSADRSHWVTLAEVSELIAFLASPAALPLNGQALRVTRE